FILFILIRSYSVERLINLKVELMPFIYTVGILGILIPVVKVSKYSVERNQEIVSTSMESTGFIVFTNKLLYMDSNDYAKMLFPELAAWEKEKKIPGNGGRFNTFLRPEFMRYVEKGIVEKEKGKSFTMNKKQYGLEFFVLHKGKRSNGYVIKFYDINA
ncbi:MAG: hypothetical protein IJ675_00225, partial [Pseudobutyrivibrio sp.]|nr:hypothetical protein [Pseudobutyrivibrio sp.]